MMSELQAELLACPAGRHDDQVDSIVQMLGYEISRARIFSIKFWWAGAASKTRERNNALSTSNNARRYMIQREVSKPIGVRNHQCLEP
jgi:phage terminase large subunit-like protein